MSGTLILKNSILAVTCVAGLTLTACASSGSQSSSSRYGSVYDYESGGNGCDTTSCGAVAQPYAGGQQMSGGQYMGGTQHMSGGQMIGGQAVSPGVVYADCSVVSDMNCNGQQPTQVYTQPATTGSDYGYSHSTMSSTTPAQCPTGTTPANDGTCMQSDSSSYGYSSTPTYPSTGYSSTTTSTHTSGGAVPCPTGTTAAGDGTCMASGSYGYSSSTTNSTYSGTTSSYGSTSAGTANCPTGTTSQGDGTCMESSSTYGSSSTTTGYTAPTTYTPPTSYLPIRK